jgi:hypothetical protein
VNRREYLRKYYQKNKEKVRARSKKWYEDNSDAALELARRINAKRTPEEIKRDKQYHREWYEKNREKQLAEAKEDYRKDPEPRKRSSRRYQALLPDDVRKIRGRATVLRVFHTTEHWYESKLAEQGNHCALCERVREENGNRLGIDHDHGCCKKYGSCGKCLRGILCRSCNVLVGNLEVLFSLGLVVSGESSGWVQEAIEYLKKYRGLG